MPALLLLASALGLNYARHRRGLSTICSTCRKRIGPRTFLIGWTALTAWIAPHYCLPFARAAAKTAAAAAEFVDDALATFDTEETP
jgi:hypothetical protein